MKKIFRGIWQYFFYGSQLVALGPVFILGIVTYLAGQKFFPLLFLTIYLVAFIIYTFDRLIDVNSETSVVRKNIYNSRKALVITLLGYSTALGISIYYMKNFLVGSLVILLLLIGVIYPLLFKKITRFVPGFKSLYVTLAYTAVIFLIPIYANISVSLGVVLLFFFFTIKCLANAIFCDIKDTDSDVVKGYKTFPAIMTGSALLSLLVALNLLSIIPIALGIFYHSIHPLSWLLILSVPYSLTYIFISFQNQRDNMLYYELADLELFLWPALIIIGGVIWAISTRLF